MSKSLRTHPIYSRHPPQTLPSGNFVYARYHLPQPQINFIDLFRGRTIQLDKLKNRIFREIENTDAEEVSLAEYRREMELLLQEKMSHVEELRQIHADINAVSFLLKVQDFNSLIIFICVDGNGHQTSGRKSCPFFGCCE